jgi:hypothetical protein
MRYVTSLLAGVGMYLLAVMLWDIFGWLYLEFRWRHVSWTPKTGQGPKVENRCPKERAWEDSGGSSREHSRRSSR